MTKLKESNLHRFLILFPRHDNKPVRRGARQDAGKKGELNFRVESVAKPARVICGKKYILCCTGAGGKGKKEGEDDGAEGGGNFSCF